MKNRISKSIHFALLLISAFVIIQSCQSSTSTSNTSIDSIDSLKNIALQLTASNDSISSNLKAFDALDYDVFSN